MPLRRSFALFAALVAVAFGASAARPPSASASVCTLPVASTACAIGGAAGKGAGDLVHGHVGKAAGDVADGAVNAACSIATSHLSHACRGIAHGAGKVAGDVLTGHPGQAVTDVVGGAAGAVTGAITSWVTDGVAGLLRDIGRVISRTSSPTLTARWFRGQYLSMMGIAALIAVPLLLLLVLQALVQQSPDLLASGVTKTVLAFVLASAGVVVVQLLLGVTDELSATVARTTGVDLAAWFGHLAKAMSVLPGVGLFIVFVVGVITALAGLAVWIELLIREAGVYIVCFFLPLILVAMIWPATARWTRRGVELLVAIILAKFFLVAIVALGAAAAGQSGSHPSLNAVLIGTGILILAAFSPFTVLALVPHAEHALSVTRGSSHAATMANSTTNQVLRGLQVAGAFAGGEGAALSAATTAGGSGANLDAATSSGAPPGTSPSGDAAGGRDAGGATPPDAGGGEGQRADTVTAAPGDGPTDAPVGQPTESPLAPAPAAGRSAAAPSPGSPSPPAPPSAPVTSGPAAGGGPGPGVGPVGVPSEPSVAPNAPGPVMAPRSPLGEPSPAAGELRLFEEPGAGRDG